VRDAHMRAMLFPLNKCKIVTREVGEG
jgi:hypothetical protein